MTREKRYKIISREIDFVDGIMSVRFDDYGEETHRALKEAAEIISTLSAEGEYIKKEDALSELEKWEWQELYLPIHFKENILDMLPTYSFPDREKGEWIAEDIHNCHTDFKCSKCGYIHNFMHLYGKPTADYTYCPNCGADMRGDT